MENWSIMLDDRRSWQSEKMGGDGDNKWVTVVMEFQGCDESMAFVGTVCCQSPKDNNNMTKMTITNDKELNSPQTDQSNPAMQAHA